MVIRKGSSSNITHMIVNTISAHLKISCLHNVLIHCIHVLALAEYVMQRKIHILKKMANQGIKAKYIKSID